MKLLRKLFFSLFIILILVGTFVFLIGFGYYTNTLHKKSLVERVEQITSKENYVPYSELSKNYINAVISVEDHRYYSHGPVDFIGIARAMYTNIRDKEFDEGGSTITQQVAKNLYFMTEKEDISRKVAELILSYHLEKNYSKDEIFELYVNTIYYGNGYYGIKEASNGYLNKNPKDLTLDESTMLAGIPNAPSVYAPTVNMDLCKNRQTKVIRSMVKYGYITQEKADNIKLGM